MKSFLRAATAALALTMGYAVVVAAPPAAAAQSTQSEIEERLTCQCGCGLTVHTCNHLNCGFAVPVRKDISESLARGETGEQIIARYVEEYGEKILSSPTTEGFNLLAWIGPYIAIIVAGILILLTIRRWIRGGPDAATEALATPQRDPAEQARLRKELEDFDQ
jgi:cytochrome c-type biogenesis protein CcmH